MARANVVPFFGVGREITSGVIGPRLADLGEPRAVAGQHRIGGVERIDYVSGESARGARGRETKKRPGALAAALDDAGLDQKFQVTRNARLRLAENRHDLAHRQFRFGE